ncbi:MAG: hypothetical protein WC028_15025 [Candidatus Obscuribacterales bacterium]
MSSEELQQLSEPPYRESLLLHYCVFHPTGVWRLKGCILLLMSATLLALILHWYSCILFELLAVSVIIYGLCRSRKACTCGQTVKTATNNSAQMELRHRKRLACLHTVPFVFMGLSLLLPNAIKNHYPLMVGMVYFFIGGVVGLLPAKYIGFTLSLLQGRWKRNPLDLPGRSDPELLNLLKSALAIKDTETADEISKEMLERAEKLELR